MPNSFTILDECFRIRKDQILSWGDVLHGKVPDVEALGNEFENPSCLDMEALIDNPWILTVSCELEAEEFLKVNG